MKKLSRNIIYGIALAVIVYIAMAIWGSSRGLREAFLFFNWKFLPLLLLLATLNFLTRFLKWLYYLKFLRIKVPVRESLMIFLSGFALSITPGKLGEMIRSYFLKKGFGAEVSRTAPIVFADRLTDLIAYLILAGVGAWGLSYGNKAILTILILIILIILLVLIRPIGLKLFGYLSKIKIISKYASKIMDLYETSYALILPKRMIFPLVVSLIAWSFEALDFYFVLVLLKLDVSAFSAFFIYCFSTIIGAVAMLPGGLGLTDGSIAGLLNFLSVNSGTAAFASMLIRAVTLWYAIIIGIVAMLLAERKYGNLNTDKFITLPKGKIKFLFHVHTKLSDDGKLEYCEIIEFCREHQISVVAVTDHNEILGAERISQMSNGNPRVIIGEEIKTKDGELIGLFLTKRISGSMSLEKTIAEIKKQNGLVCLPHPGDSFRRSAISRVLSKSIIDTTDIVEVFNSRNLFKSSNKFAYQLAKSKQKNFVAGADAHMNIELKKAINIIDDFEDQQSFLSALNDNSISGTKTGFLTQAYAIILKKLKRNK